MPLRLLRGCSWSDLSAPLLLVGFPLFVCLLSRIVFKFVVFAGRAGALVSIISVMVLTFHVCVGFFACVITVAPSLVYSCCFHMFVFGRSPQLHGSKDWRVLRAPIL